MGSRPVVMLSVLVSLCCLVVSAAWASDLEALADRASSALANGDFATAVSELHHPREDSFEKRAGAQAKAAASIERVSQKIGAVRRVRLAPDPAAFFEVSVGGADAAYWRSHRPARVEQYAYFGRFGHYGPGFIVVHVMRMEAGDAPEVRRIGFGVPMDRASRPRVDELMRALLD